MLIYNDELGRQRSVASLRINFAVIILISAMLITLPSCSKNNRYVNKEVGYEITGPPDWYIYPSSNGGVSFARYNREKYGNSTISVLVDTLISNANTPLGYMNDIFLPQMQQQFQEQEKFTIEPISGPRTVEMNGYQWATVKYWLAENTLQIVYITFSRRNIFVIVLNSTGSQHTEEEDLFFNAFDSFKIYE